MIVTCAEAEAGLIMKRHVAKRTCKLNHLGPQLYPYLNPMNLNPNLKLHLCHSMSGILAY